MVKLSLPSCVFLIILVKVRYGLRVAANPGEWTEIGVAGFVSMGALMSKPALRPSMPYAGMLIIMDSAQVIMRDWDKR